MAALLQYRYEQRVMLMSATIGYINAFDIDKGSSTIIPNSLKSLFRGCIRYKFINIGVLRLVRDSGTELVHPTHQKRRRI